MNLTNELAKQRNRDAAERTLMAWIRTCLSLISFGFGLDKIVGAIDRAAGGQGAQVEWGCSWWLRPSPSLGFSPWRVPRSNTAESCAACIKTTTSTETSPK